MTQSLQEQSLVAVYRTHTAAEASLNTLQQAGINTKRMSLIGKDLYTEGIASGVYTIGNLTFKRGNSVSWGGLWGLLFGGSFFVLPTIGPVVVMGPLVGWIVITLGAALDGAAGALTTALASFGLSTEQAAEYELDIKAGSFLVLTRGDTDMIEQTRAVLASTGASQLRVKRAPDTTQEKT